MSIFHLIFFIWILLIVKCLVALGSASWCQHQFLAQTNRQFEQKTDRFWEFKEQTNSWVEVQLPYDLVSCLNDNCTVVGSIEGTNNKEEHIENQSDDVSGKRERVKKNDGYGGLEKENNSDVVLPLRKRISLTKMSDMSIWVTGESGSIYERFWNGVQWVMAPHDLPISGAHAVSVFIVNHTILALSESGNLYQMKISESSQPIWVDFTPTLSQSTDEEGEQSSVILIKSGLVSYDGERVYFCTKKGTLLELREIEPPRWVDHGQPPGANAAAIADAAGIRTDVIYTISSAGDLYEYDRSSKPSWKKHIRREGTAYDASLIPLTGSTLHGASGDHSISLFLLTKDGKLVERRLYQRKWKWVVYGSPKDQRLTSITPVLLQDDTNGRLFSLFFTTSTGSVFEYQIPRQSGIAQENPIPEAWVSHIHPLHAKVARGISGLQIQVGRILFPLDDGRLAELHLSGLGGENSGPSHQVNFRKKAAVKYLWSILDAPESEGWNAEYCIEQRGPTNCITGVKDEPNDLGIARTMTRRRKGSQTQQHYLTPGTSGSGPTKPLEEYSFPDNWLNTNFHLRAMHGGRSFFLITDGGFTFEYLYTENVWMWLRHEHSTAIKGALGNYNGSLYVVDANGSVLLRERNSNDLAWINCTALRKGRQVVGGPPWDGIPGRTTRVTAEDALFFVSRNGRLLQFTVALRKFKWKDCRNPPNTKIASIVDQELLRENIVFVVGRNGRLYQYNKVTELWHEHYQSQHLILSRLPGTAMRSSLLSLTGSLFMLSVDGGLVEYHWNTFDGWNWVEHGSPHKVVTLVGSPGPSFEGNQLFLIGSNGNVYLRYMDEMTWRWKNCGFPFSRNANVEDRRGEEGNDKAQFCTDVDFAASSKKDYERVNDLNSDCNQEVAPIRPIPLAEDSIIFELKDGRLAEMRRIEGTHWMWSRIIGTPTSLCTASYWTALAS
ncbi:hypothetical protein PRUPE_4G254900 [Prunus persica]|uniref:Bulb-type lectin domain-containing protein n=2 Tax=Prunus persica TaxID=3760 RepID=M5WME9_PRUPE|nr:uncharacterized protein LOC18778403 [Prunus persica]ONI13965.1 hypothetical protein PRUPE_4G254900 [Prunus persica]